MSGKDAAPLRRFIDSLNRTDRQVLLLSYADGLTAHEIATVLGHPESKVTTILRRLREEARSRFFAYPHDQAVA